MVKEIKSKDFGLAWEDVDIVHCKNKGLDKVCELSSDLGMDVVEIIARDLKFNGVDQVSVAYDLVSAIMFGDKKMGCKLSTGVLSCEPV